MMGMGIPTETIDEYFRSTAPNAVRHAKLGVKGLNPMPTIRRMSKGRTSHWWQRRISSLVRVALDAF